MEYLENAKSRVEIARGYAEYVPEEYAGMPERERFLRVLDSIERSIKMAELSGEN